ncbi:DUF7667 family protein [Halalkalibacterium halodurans]|uniref:DUF7667 family protein n=1 Tax=Halalkalibacterium halodurans TaxID=86665 RepID=UPI002AA986EB|nr:hypothetical protein [Halalkalibacterium halodurans]MDY7224677.1 hypothetical protein [Halalkalibacterium halodurans]MDY7243273.1 hypothetical protein [Halalkalibacterium halodurans]
MTIQVHPVHRRLAELTLKAHHLGGYRKLSTEELTEIDHCLQASAMLIVRLDELKSLSFLAHETQDTEWQHAICNQIDEIANSWR